MKYRYRTTSRAAGPLLIWALVFVMSGSSGAAATWGEPSEYERIRELGGANAFTPGPIESDSDLVRFFEQYRADIVAALELAAWQGDPEDLFDAVRAGAFTELQFPVGSKVEWMAFRRGGRDIYVVSNAIWGGDESFAAYEIRFVSGDWQYAFIVPGACGNLALYSKMGTAELTVSVAAGELNLVDPEGRPITIRAGETGTVTAPPVRIDKAMERGEPEVPTSLEVSEGVVEFQEYGRPISVLVGEGNAVSAVLTPEGTTALAVPSDNPAPLPIRVGDAVGTLSAGAGMAVGWTPPVCVLEVSPASDCVPADLVVDASGSSVSHGEIVSVGVAVTGADGEVRTLGAPQSPGAFRWTTRLEEPGTYRVAAVAVSDTGTKSENLCTAEVEVKVCLPPPPTCSLEVTTAEVEPFEEVRLDVSGSRSEGGRVQTVAVGVFSQAGERLVEREFGAPFRGAMKFQQGGTFTCRAVAIDEHGQRSENPCERTIRVGSRFTTSEWFFGGHARSLLDNAVDGQDGAVGGLKASVHFLVSKDLEVAGGIGGVFDSDTNDTGLFVDFELNWLMNRGFIGSGFGTWNVGRGEGLGANWLIHAGRDLPLRVGGQPVQVFAEGRLFLEELSALDENFVVLAGIRLRQR